MRALLTVAMCLLLQACGGATAQVIVAPLLVPQPVPFKAAPPTGGAGDAMSKAVTTIRDVPDAAGGDVGFVNAAHFIKTSSGKNETSLEWASLTILENRSDRSEGNTASYSQANKLSTGATFAGVSEASDTTGLPGALVSHEFDSWVTGPDNGLRIGLEIVNGDALAIRGLGKSVVSESTAAIRVGQTISTPYAAWTRGLHFTGNYLKSVIEITDPVTGVTVFEVKANGDIYRRGVLVP